MRFPLFGSSLLLSLGIASAASAVAMDWTFVGNHGNACETQPDLGTGGGCFGGVGYAYRIATYEVTNAQYAEFLNAKAASDPLGLYNTNMTGISRSGVSGSHTYSVYYGVDDWPVNVSFYDTLRFANWLNNGQRSGDTETGAYTLLGGTPEPSNGATVTRNPEATIFLTSEDEWYKAAYYDATSTSYFDFPAASDTQTTCARPTATANQANCSAAVGFRTTKGWYTGSASPYGTFDQGGNLWEWNEAISGSFRGRRGGDFSSEAWTLGAFYRGRNDPTNEASSIGFRVASIVPEPSTGLLVIAGLLGLAGWRRFAPSAIASRSQGRSTATRCT